MPVGKPVKHVLSHRIIYAHLYKITIPSTRKVPSEFVRIPKNKLPQYAVSRLVQKLLAQLI